MDTYAGTEFTHAGDPDPDSSAYLATDCGWTFGGYAAALYDHPDNTSAAWDPNGVGCGPKAGSALGYHLSTTSTSTVFLDLHMEGTWRLYFPPAAVVSSCGASEPYPEYVLGFADSTSLPDDPSEWEASGRFNSLYVSFLDSSDGGMTFPVYGPRMTSMWASAFRCPERWRLVDWDGAGWTATAVPGFTGADLSGPQLDPDRDGVYAVYRDVTVIDLWWFGEERVAGTAELSPTEEWRYAGDIAAELFEEIREREAWVAGTPWLPVPDILDWVPPEPTVRQLYLMICVETRSLTPFPKSLADGGCSPVVSCDGCEFPFTRVVLFISESPDFGPFSIQPEPGRVADAFVLLQPDYPTGGAGPELVDLSNTATCPSEWYGVTHALLTPDRTSLIVYAPHVGPEGQVPARISARYACANEANIGDWPCWQNVGGEGDTTVYQGTGISCFRLDVAELQLHAFALLDAVHGPYETTERVRFQEWLLHSMEAGYQGEVLITDGRRPTGPDGTETSYYFYPCADEDEDLKMIDKPNTLPNTDPQFVYCGSQLWVYFDINNTSEVEGQRQACGTDGLIHAAHPQDQLRRARLATVDEVNDLYVDTANFTEALKLNGDYTIFLADPADCFVAFDMRELVETSANPADWDSNTSADLCSDGQYGTMVADPDLLVAADGRLVARYFGGCNDPSAAPGLLYSYTSRALC